MNCLLIVMSSYLLQSRKELTKSVSFHSDTHPEDGRQLQQQQQHLRLVQQQQQHLRLVQQQQ